jgi:hypothetical protein
VREMVEEGGMANEALPFCQPGRKEALGSHERHSTQDFEPAQGLAILALSDAGVFRN